MPTDFHSTLLQHDHDKLTTGLVRDSFERLWSLGRQAILTLSSVATAPGDEGRRAAANVRSYMEQLKSGQGEQQHDSCIERRREEMLSVLEATQALLQSRASARAGSGSYGHDPLAARLDLSQQHRRISADWRKCVDSMDVLLQELCSSIDELGQEKLPDAAAAVVNAGRGSMGSGEGGGGVGCGGNGGGGEVRVQSLTSQADCQAGKECSACGERKGAGEFSNKQWKVKAHSRRCRTCAPEG